MSSYKDFSKCIICRSKKNFRDYKGNFEVTMLLNNLYLSLMYILEKREELHFKSSKIIPVLKEKEIVDLHNNDFTNDDIARYLRNALAHFNIEISNDPYGNKIEQIRLWSKNCFVNKKCKDPCSNPKCIPIKYNSDKNGEICTFVFTVKQLKEYVEVVTNIALENPSLFCETCKYRKCINE